MRLKQFILCAAAVVLPLAANAASGKNKDRWFEVEVILFSQLGDKSQLKEHFPDSIELPKYRRTLDLLADYINPDIASLKQLLPNCESPYYPADLVSQNAKLPALFKEKSLADIAQLPALEPQAFNSQNEAIITEQNYRDNTHFTELSPNETTNQDNSSINDSAIAQLLPERSEQERAEIQALVVAAEQEFSRFKFQYTTKKADITSQQIWCRLDEKRFTELKANDSSFDYNGFTIDSMPLTISAIENIADNNSHLLNKESLQLSDIITDLRYSKNFRPILHMGWRQVARPKKQATAVKIYAGDNFAADYQKQVANYQTQQAQLLEMRANSDAIAQAIARPEIDNNIAETQSVLLAQAKKARIENIVSQISDIPNDTEQLLNTIKNNDLTLKISETPSSQINDITAPSAPIQNWFIEGLFNIHLKHYLFITADFNILDKNLAELATAKLAQSPVAEADSHEQVTTDIPTQAKAIRFKQNRRVISGEVHYFDHPYMGMIVQIRPYKKPQLEAEN